MRKTTRGLGLILLATLTLSGCSLTLPGQSTPKPENSTSSEEPQDPQEQPAAGEEISGESYTYRAPEGWEEYEYPGDPKPDTFMVRFDDAGEATSNFNTIPSPAGKVTADQIETQGVAEFDDLEGSSVTVNDRVQIAGAEAAYFTVQMKNGDGEYVIEQFYPTSDEATYVASFTFNVDVPEDERTKAIEATLASWEWK